MRISVLIKQPHGFSWFISSGMLVFFFQLMDDVAKSNPDEMGGSFECRLFITFLLRTPARAKRDTYNVDWLPKLERLSRVGLT
jgi:hypothetical protein